MTCDGALDEAYQRFHATGPEFEGFLSNHGPMAAEALVALGRGDDVHRWVDAYFRKLEEPPVGGASVDAAEWRDALGDVRRVPGWTRLLLHEVEAEPWRDVLARWWPRLLPGIAAGATHGVIRTGHAVRALLAEETAPRREELAHALAYWAARWQPVPASAAVPAGPVPADAGAGLARVPRVPRQEGGIRDRLAQLDGLAGWPVAAPPADDATSATAAVAAAAVRTYARRGHGNPVMLVHAATAPAAVALALPALPPALHAASARAAWAASTAVVAAYAAADDRPAADVPRDLDDAVDRAVAHGDEHAVKLTEAAVRTAPQDAPAAVARALTIA